MAAHVFVDETKRSGFALAAVAFDDREVRGARLGMKGFLLPRQRRIHFKNESPSRRTAILAALPGFGASAVIVTTPNGMDALKARRSAMRELGLWAVQIRAVSVCIEREESVEAMDRQVLFGVLSKGTYELNYGHSRPYDEPLLWAADAIAWAWPQGGDWRRKADAVIAEVIEV